MDQIHNNLMKRKGWYHFWHSKKGSQAVHWTVFACVALLFTVAIYARINNVGFLKGLRGLFGFASSNITVSSTSRQILLSYTAPDANPCTIEVSENSSFSPLVTDVNPTLFPGANMDNRAGSLGAGTTSRTFVVGTIPDMKGLI